MFDEDIDYDPKAAVFAVKIVLAVLACGTVILGGFLWLLVLS